jgi:hypothetical protein
LEKLAGQAGEKSEETREESGEGLGVLACPPVLFRDSQADAGELGETAAVIGCDWRKWAF